MTDSVDLTNIARRAVARVLERSGGAASGVHVSATPQGPEKTVKSRSTPLVTIECLRSVDDGGRFEVPFDATVTPLAREEAFARGIELVSRKWQASARRVAVGADHGGFTLKASVIETLAELGVEARDMGTHSAAAVDYPDYAEAVAREVAEGRASLGIVVDGAGIGSAMAANKVPGVLAANCWDERTAKNAREHNHANVLTLGSGHLDESSVREVVTTFLSTPVGPDRHARRVDKIRALEVRP